jgi:hypothetical protein
MDTNLMATSPMATVITITATNLPEAVATKAAATTATAAPIAI